VALLAIKFFIRFVQRYGFQAFGWYRIIVGGIILALLFTGHELTILQFTPSNSSLTLAA
jgi:undecaprenyl-diphosphatase